MLQCDHDTRLFCCVVLLSRFQVTLELLCTDVLLRSLCRSWVALLYRIAVLSLSAENLDPRVYKNRTVGGIILLIQSWKTFSWKASLYFHLPACLVVCSSPFRAIISHFREAMCGHAPAGSAIMISRLSVSHRSQTEEVRSGRVNCEVGENLGGPAGAQGVVMRGWSLMGSWPNIGFGAGTVWHLHA